MEGNKVRLLRLSGCGWCSQVVYRLESLGIQFETVNVNEEDEFADRIEALLDTLLYPIIIVDKPIETWYIFRPSHDRELNQVVTIGPNDYKVGCNTITDIVEVVQRLLK